MDAFQILGMQIVSEAQRPLIVGDGGSFGGFDPKFLIDAAAELSKRGVDSYESGEAKKQSDAATAVQLQKAIAADAAWANAEAVLAIANQSHDAARIAPAQALQSSAMTTALSAGAGLPADAVAKRVAAAQDAANKAAQDALNNPKDAAKQATSQAWQKVVAAAGSGGGLLAPGGGKGGFHTGGGGNFLTKKFGPLPVWGWGALTIGVVGGGLLVVKMLRK